MQSCKKCGILKTPLTRWSKDANICCACSIAQQADQSKTPCGQAYCQNCGILLDLPTKDDRNLCVACALSRLNLQNRNRSGMCKCDFCSNHYNIPFKKKASPRKNGTVAVKFCIPPMKKTVDGASTGNGLAETSRVGSSPSAVHNYLAEYYPIPDRTSYICNQSKLTSWDSAEGKAENVGDSGSAWDICLHSQPEEEYQQKWERKQMEMRDQLVVEDAKVIKEMISPAEELKKDFYVGGVDISFIKGNDVDACAAVVVLSYPKLEVVYQKSEMVKLALPYIPGYLAFREVGPIKQVYEDLLTEAPQFKPDVILVDGNGMLHPRKFGVACHLGVELGVPSIGVAKTLMRVDGIADDEHHKAKKMMLKNAGDVFELKTNSGETLGVALRATEQGRNPIYVSVGHQTTLKTAVQLVKGCCRFRIPEPIRQADQLSRQFLAGPMPHQKQAPHKTRGVHSQVIGFA